MSSLRNAVQRRNHRERAQPHERSKWGLLEKHKDYSLRAQDHNTKKRRIKALRQKASERNEDEFYFGMMSSKSKGGIKVAQRGEGNSGGVPGAGKSLGADVVKLMKTQDSAYLRTMLQNTKKQREKAEREEIVLDNGVPTQAAGPARMVFGSDAEDVRPQISPPNGLEDFEADLEDEESADDHALRQPEDMPISNKERAAKKKRRFAVNIARRRVDALRDREKSLIVALREVDDQCSRMNGTAGGVNKHGTKYKSRQRQR